MEYSPWIYSYTAVIIVQVLFLIYFLIGIIRVRKLKPSPDPIPLSVVVAAKNEAVNLERLIPEILGQKYPEFELIIVNDQSVDKTEDILRDFELVYSNLKVVNIKETPDHIARKKYALTLGIKAASHDQVVLTDADCSPASKEWLSTMGTAFKNPSTRLVIGFSPYQRKKGLLNLFIRFETLLTGIQYIGKAGWGRSYMAVGRNLGIKKSFFLEKNGYGKFKSLISGDDDLFVNEHSNSRNTDVVLQKESTVVSKPLNNWNAYFYQKIRHYSVGKYYKFSDKFFLGLFNLSRLLHWIFLFIGLYVTNNYYLFIVIFTFWALIYSLSFEIIRKRSGAKFPSLVTVFVDLFFYPFFLVVGVIAFFSKKVKWI